MQREILKTRFIQSYKEHCAVMGVDLGDDSGSPPYSQLLAHTWEVRSLEQFWFNRLSQLHVTHLWDYKKQHLIPKLSSSQLTQIVRAQSHKGDSHRVTKWPATLIV